MQPSELKTADEEDPGRLSDNCEHLELELHGSRYEGLYNQENQAAGQALERTPE